MLKSSFWVRGFNFHGLTQYLTLLTILSFAVAWLVEEVAKALFLHL